MTTSEGRRARGRAHNGVYTDPSQETSSKRWLMWQRGGQILHPGFISATSQRPQIKKEVPVWTEESRQEDSSRQLGLLEDEASDFTF